MSRLNKHALFILALASVFFAAGQPAGAKLKKCPAAFSLIDSGGPVRLTLDRHATLLEPLREILGDDVTVNVLPSSGRTNRISKAYRTEENERCLSARASGSGAGKICLSVSDQQLHDLVVDPERNNQNWNVNRELLRIALALSPSIERIRVESIEQDDQRALDRRLAAGALLSDAVTSMRAHAMLRQLGYRLDPADTEIRHDPDFGGRAVYALSFVRDPVE